MFIRSCVALRRSSTGFSEGWLKSQIWSVGTEASWASKFVGSCGKLWALSPVESWGGGWLKSQVWSVGTEFLSFHLAKVKENSEDQIAELQSFVILGSLLQWRWQWASIGHFVFLLFTPVLAQYFGLSNLFSEPWFLISDYWFLKCYFFISEICQWMSSYFRIALP